MDDLSPKERKALKERIKLELVAGASNENEGEARREAEAVRGTE
jgi:hypothetical protein